MTENNPLVEVLKELIEVPDKEAYLLDQLRQLQKENRELKERLEKIKSRNSFLKNVRG